MDPVGWRVLGIFDRQLNDPLLLEQARAGAHGEAPHLLHAGDEEVHPAQTHTQTHRHKTDTRTHTHTFRGPMLVALTTDYNLHAKS